MLTSPTTNLHGSPPLFPDKEPLGQAPSNAEPSMPLETWIMRAATLWAATGPKFSTSAFKAFHKQWDPAP